MMSSASAEPSSLTFSAGSSRKDKNDQAQTGAIASPEEKRGLLQELASVFMDSAADVSKGSPERAADINATNGTTADADHAQASLPPADNEHLLQAMQRLSAAVERNSTELGEFRAAQQRLQEQTLQILMQTMTMKGGNDNDVSTAKEMTHGQKQVQLSNVSNDERPTRKGRAEEDDGEDDLSSFKTITDANVEDEDKEEETDQSQELERKRDRLDGLEVYAVVSALSAGTMVAVFDSYQPSGATGGDVIDLFQHGKYLEFLMSATFLVAGSIGIVCSLHCIFVFSLVTMYGRTAIGMGRDDALDIFFAGTGVQRFHGFKTFVGSLYALMFELIVVITSKVSDKPFVHLTAIVLTSRLMYNVYSDTQIIIDKASVIFAPRPQSSSDSTNDEDDASLSLSLGCSGNNHDDDESISVPELISDKQNSPTDTTTQGTSVPSLSSSLSLRYNFSMKRRSSDRRLSSVSSMNLGAEELIRKGRNEEMQKKDRAKILVVDDSAVSRRLLAKRVEKLDHVADQAVDGEEALKMLRDGAVAGKANQYDLVLLDMFMPKLNGDEVLEEMQKNKDLQNIPVIMISGNEDVSQKAKCIELGASDFLPKPFDNVIFKARVVACLQAKRLRDLQDSSDDASGVEDSASSCAESTNNNGSFRSLGPMGSGKKSTSYRRRRSSATSMNVGAEQLMKEEQEAKQIPKILVVDDSATSRRLLAKRVEKLGHDVKMACDGQQALDILQGTESGKSGERIDLVLLDMFMPKLNGDEVLEKMKKDESLKNIPVIMISGAEDVSQKARCIELGASDFLPKPFDPVIFKARVVACLRAKRIQERRRSTGT